VTARGHSITGLSGNGGGGWGGLGGAPRTEYLIRESPGSDAPPSGSQSSPHEVSGNYLDLAAKMEINDTFKDLVSGVPMVLHTAGVNDGNGVCVRVCVCVCVCVCVREQRELWKRGSRSGNPRLIFIRLRR
jgi:hypothetical protein